MSQIKDGEDIGAICSGIPAKYQQAAYMVMSVCEHMSLKVVSTAADVGVLLIKCFLLQFTVTLCIGLTLGDSSLVILLMLPFLGLLLLVPVSLVAVHAFVAGRDHHSCFRGLGLLLFVFLSLLPVTAFALGATAPSVVVFFMAVAHQVIRFVLFLGGVYVVSWSHCPLQGMTLF